jgi:hypothetical protein
MREAGATSTWVAGCAVHSIMLAPPGVVMVAPLEPPRNAQPGRGFITSENPIKAKFAEFAFHALR